MNLAHVDPFAAAEFIGQRMYKRLSLAGAECLAVAETEHPVGADTWFWTDDNAKVIEFLARPELCGRYRRQSADAFRFIRAMCRGPLIFRRAAMPCLVTESQHGSEVRFTHSLMDVRCDLSLGAVVAGVRFHDGRTAENLLLWTNQVEFTYRGRRYVLPVERSIDRRDATVRDRRLELRYSAELFFTPRRTKLRLGRISYLYTFDASSIVIGVEATLEVDAAIEVTDVVMTIGHDHLSHARNAVHYTTLRVQVPGGVPLRFEAEQPTRQVLAVDGADYYAFVQSAAIVIAGYARAAHSAPREPGHLSEIEVEVREPGRLHLARARYRFAGSCRGRRLVAAEDKMLTEGGFYERTAEYSRLLRDAVAAGPTGAAVDASVSYDYGAELNGFAEYFRAVLTAPDAAAAEEVRALYDLYLEAYTALFVEPHYRGENTIHARQLGFVVLSLATMLRATGNAVYRKRLVQLVGVLLEFESRLDDVAGEPASGFLHGIHPGPRIVYCDSHSAALLALIEAADQLDDPWLVAAIDRGLCAYGVATERVDPGDRSIKADLVGVQWVDGDGARQFSSAFWNYHGGLLLRLFGRLRRATNPALRGLAARHRERIELFEFVLRRQIARSLTWHQNALEIRTSMLSGETNSETQPWVALGLLEAAGA
jgi:hypothetical protein